MLEDYVVAQLVVNGVRVDYGDVTVRNLIPQQSVDVLAVCARIC